MYRLLNRNQVAEISADHSIANLDGKNVNVVLQGALLPGTLQASENGAAVVTFETPGAYFGLNEFEITGPDFNNFTAHALDALGVKG